MNKHFIWAFIISSLLCNLLLVFLLYKSITKPIDVNLVQYPVFQNEELK